MLLLAAEAAPGGSFAQIDVPGWAWLALVVSIVVLLLADLYLVHRVPHEIPVREALVESAVWIAIPNTGVGISCFAT